METSRGFWGQVMETSRGKWWKLAVDNLPDTGLIHRNKAFIKKRWKLAVNNKARFDVR